MERTETGRFAKGLTPRNKGGHKKSRPGMITERGRQGFLPRPVLVINYDGSVKHRFASVGEAQKALGKADRHTIANACTRGYLCRGWKLMYEDDWSPLGDYRYKPTPGRNLDGSLKPGHTMSPIYAARQSAETRKMRSDKARELCRRLNATPGSNWGRYLDKRKPVECLTTGERFASIGEAAARYNLPQNYISSAISRNGTVHGLKFQKI